MENFVFVQREAVQGNIVKCSMFNGKISYRIVETDSVDDTTMLMPVTQADKQEYEKIDGDKIILEERATNIMENREEKCISSYR